MNDIIDAVKNAANRLEKNFKIYWPANKDKSDKAGTPPTEHNIALAIAQALEMKGYASFIEVPFKSKDNNCRYDLLAINQDKGIMIVGEMKSNSCDYAVIETEFQNRLLKFDKSNLFFCKDFIDKAPKKLSEIYVISAFWSENINKIQDMKNKFANYPNLNSIINGCNYCECYPIENITADKGLHLCVILKKL